MLISRYPLIAFLVASLDFVKAGGSRITYVIFFAWLQQDFGNSSNTFAQQSELYPEVRLSVHWLLPEKLRIQKYQVRVTSLAPAIPAFNANVPMWVKQSNTFLPLHIRCIARRLYF